MDTSRAAGPGLRERKKQQTREALSWAALRLAVERGLGNVLVEDIAAEAGVSPRTYNNYFSSKAEAITWRHLDRARRIADLLRARPPGEPLWESITCAAVAQAGGERASPDPPACGAAPAPADATPAPANPAPTTTAAPTMAESGSFLRITGNLPP